MFSNDWANSDESCFKKGDKNVTAGLSLGYFGPYATFDYTFHEAISVGGGMKF